MRDIVDVAGADGWCGNTNKLILIRGVPGTGKSTLAKQYVEQGFVHFEADMFFVDSDSGEYKFDGSKIADAHDWCQESTRKALSEGKNVVVSNTFTRLWEMEPYRQFAYSIGADVEIITLTREYGSVHNVPDAAMQRMRSRFEY